MKNRILGFVGFVIIACGLLFYMNALTADYVVGKKKAETIGSKENVEIKLSAVTQMAVEGKKEEAIDLLLESIEESPKELSLQLKLAQLYAIQCKEDQIHCDEAMWQINLILEIDSTNQPAKLMLKEMNSLLMP